MAFNECQLVVNVLDIVVSKSSKLMYYYRMSQERIAHMRNYRKWRY